MFYHLYKVEYNTKVKGVCHLFLNVRVGILVVEEDIQLVETVV